MISFLGTFGICQVVNAKFRRFDSGSQPCLKADAHGWWKAPFWFKTSDGFQRKCRLALPSPTLSLYRFDTWTRSWLFGEPVVQTCYSKEPFPIPVPLKELPHRKSFVVWGVLAVILMTAGHESFAMWRRVFFFIILAPITCHFTCTILPANISVESRTSRMERRQALLTSLMVSQVGICLQHCRFMWICCIYIYICV